MNDDLIQQLLFAEADFLDALQNGSQTLASYRQSLSTLPHALSAATKTGGASNDTLSLAHSVASRILNLASCFLDIKREEELSTSQLQNDCDAMFRQMEALDLNAQSKSSPPADGRTSALNSSNLTPAYQWLLNNLHNPYPTAEAKARIAVASCCQVSSINSWFINARRRIGWTTLCREHFSNCRADMIDAAYRALAEEDSQRPLSPELQHSFVAIRVAAEDLYSSTFTRSAFTGDLDAIVKDMTKENRESHVTERGNLQAVEDSYPSPDPSTSASPIPTLSDSLTDESEEDEDIAPPVVAGSKRCRSSMEPDDQPPSTSSRPIKRLRASVLYQGCLPSPPSSTNDIDESSHRCSPELPHMYPTLLEIHKVLPSHKRRLSDVDAPEMMKRSRDSVTALPLQTVSEPSPRPGMENEHPVDDWFNANFDDLFAIPPPVDATEPDLSAGWEVELFKDYSIPGNPKYAPQCSPAPTYMSAPSDLSDFDSLLRSIGSDTFITPADAFPQSAITGTSYTVPSDSSICNVSQTSIDWASLLNGTETYQPTIYSASPQCPTDSQPLAEIDLSMLQLPQVIPAVNSQGDSASKQARLQQLHAMQEAVWRMEQELRSEGVVM